MKLQAEQLLIDGPVGKIESIVENPVRREALHWLRTHIHCSAAATPTR